MCAREDVCEMNVKGLQLRLIEAFEGGGGRNVRVSVCECVCDPTLPECKRWITMETDQ